MLPLAVLVLVATLSQLGEEQEARHYFESPESIAICETISSANYPELRRLLASGVNLNLQAKNGLTPLFWAWLRGDTTAFELLLEYGSDPHLTPGKSLEIQVNSEKFELSEGTSLVANVLKFAQSRPAFVELSLRYLRLPDQQDSQGGTLLHTLLENSLSYNSPLGDGNVKWQGFNPVQVVLLLNAGVDINGVNHEGLTAVRTMVQRATLKLSEPTLVEKSSLIDFDLLNRLQFLRNRGADFQLKSPDGTSLVDDLEKLLGARPELSEVSKYLLLLKKSKRESPPPSFCLEEPDWFWSKSFFWMFKDYESQEVSVSIQEGKGQPFYFGAPNDSKSVASTRSFDELYQIGFDPNVKGEAGFTLLWAAVLTARAKEYEALLDKGASPDSRLTENLWVHIDKFPESFDKESTFVKNSQGILRSSGAEFCPASGDTVLMFACLNPFRRKDFIVPALRVTKDPNIRDELGRNLLHRLLYHPLLKGQDSLVRTLIQSGVDVNAQTVSGSTPCHVAVRMNPETIPILVTAGADPHLPNAQGQTTIDLLKMAVEEKWAREEGCKLALERLLAQ